jgi:hypothetical protein
MSPEPRRRLRTLVLSETLEVMSMAAPRERTLGLAFVASGLAAVVLGVLLFGLTTVSGAIDWVSVVTVGAGLVVLGEGFYLTFHRTAHQ